MGSRSPWGVAAVESRQKGGDGDQRRAPAAAVLPGGRLWRGVLDLSSLCHRRRSGRQRTDGYSTAGMAVASGGTAAAGKAAAGGVK